MDKKYYIWLQIIQDKNNNFNYSILKEILNYLNIDLIKLYNLEFDIFLLKKINKSLQSIIQAILDNDIKEELEKLMIKIKRKELYTITIKDKLYPKRLMEKYENFPFCIFVNNKINFNRKNIYLYYDEKFTNYGIKVLKYFAKIIADEKGNIYTKYNLKSSIECLNIDEYNKTYKNCIIVLNNKLKSILLYQIIDIVIIVEASYKKEIVDIVDNFLHCNKDIYCVPSNIFGKNCYFSNYLIKQGADIILNKWDLKFVLSNII